MSSEGASTAPSDASPMKQRIARAKPALERRPSLAACAL